MTLEQLRIFVAVADRQHVTRAAEALNVAQSAVSASIAALEARHGAKLFHRLGRGIALTEAGALFLVEARAVLARAEAAELVLSELGGLKRGTLVVQASQTIASYWLPRYLVAFRRSYPGISISLKVGNTAQVATAITQGSAELGFVEGGRRRSLVRAPGRCTRSARDRGWSGSRLGADRASGHASAPDRERVGDAGGRIRHAFGVRGGTRRIRRAGRQPPLLALELPSNESVRAAVEAGMGATAISASVAAPSIEAGLLHAVNLALPERRFYVLRHRERYHSHAGDALLAMFAPG